MIINGVATRSCITPVSGVKSEITTLEGLAKNGVLHPVQQAWIEEQVPQCGFCQNGQIMTAKALLDKTPNPTDKQIREGMSRTLCRCMTYYRVQSAIKLAARKVAENQAAKAKEGAGVKKFSKVPKRIEAALSRRGFLQSAGILVVSFAVPKLKAQAAPGLIPTPTFANSIPGL